VRVERVVLEDHRDVAVLRRQPVDDAVGDADLAAGDVLEPGDHPQRGRLAAAGRADQDDELAVGDLEVQVGDSLRPVRVDLRDLFESDLCHERRESITIAWQWQPLPNEHRERAGAISSKTAVSSRPR
jgi:hypothetical protein